MKPTNEELINGCGEDLGFNSGNCRKGDLCDYCLGIFQGRLDVLEDWLDYHKGQDRVLIREISKIKEVLK